MDLVDQTNQSLSEENYANQPKADTLNNSSSDPDNHEECTELYNIIQERKQQLNEALLIHLNINSPQNKFDELKGINDQQKSHIIFVSETTINKSSQIISKRPI